MIYTILKRKKYFSVAIITATVIFALFYYLTVYNITGKSIFSYAMMSGLLFTIVSLLLSLVLSLLFGVYLALIIARRDIIKKRSSADKLAGGGGGAIGLLAAGCPTCGAPIFAFFGFPLALMALPFKGLELKVLSIILLGWAIYSLAKNIKKSLTCEVNKHF